MTFDARAMKSLMPTDKPITDPAYPGLRFEVSASTKTWVYRYRSPVDGALRQKKIGNWPAVSVHQAVVKWEALRDVRDAGRDPVLEGKADKAKAAERQAKEKEARARGAYTVIDLCDDYINNLVVARRKPSGVKDVVDAFKRIPKSLGELPAVSITRAQAFELIESVIPEAPTMASRMKSELSCAWEYGLDSSRLPEETPNWWPRILKGKIRSNGRQRGGKKTGKVERSLSPDEVRTLLQWLLDLSESIRDALTLYLWTGARGAEITAMEGREISDEAGQWWWTIPKAKTKNVNIEGATDLRIPLFGRALDIVRRRKELYGDGFLFPSTKKGMHLNRRAVTTEIYRRMPYCKPIIRPGRSPLILPKCPVTNWAPHDLRRTARTFLSMLGCEFQLAELIVGHVMPGIAGSYDKYSYDPQRAEWLKKLSEYLESLSQPVAS